METNTYQSDLAIHPGEYLEEVLEDIGMSQAALSNRVGRPTQAINEIIKGKKSIIPATAIELEDVLKVPAHIWVGLKAEYQMVKAKQEELKVMKEESALADLYDPLAMPSILKKAHQESDKEVDKCYTNKALKNDKERIELKSSGLSPRKVL